MTSRKISEALRYPLSLFASALLMGGVVYQILGCKGALKGPWTLAEMAALKHQEMTAYWLCALGIPVLGLVFAKLSTFIVPSHSTKTRVKRSPDLRPTDFFPPWFVKTIFWGIIPFFIFLYGPRRSFSANMQEGYEGLKMSAANQFISGKKPYKDIYFQYGPGTEILQPLLAFTFFGMSFEAHRRSEWFTDPMGGVAIYFLALIAFRRRRFVFLLALFMMGGISFWVSSRATLPALAFCFLLKALASSGIKRRNFHMVSGFLFMAAFLYSMEAGLLPGAAVGLYYLIRAIRSWGSKRTIKEVQTDLKNHLIGVSFLFVPLLVYLILNGALVDFIRNSFFVGSTLLPAWGKPTPILCEPLKNFILSPTILFTQDGLYVRWWFPVLLNILVLFIWLRKGPNKTEKNFDYAPLLFALAGTFFFVVALGRTDYEHWLKGVPFYWILVFVLIDRGFDAYKKMNRPWLRKGILASVLFFLLFSFHDFSFALFRNNFFDRQVYPPHTNTYPVSSTDRFGQVPLHADEISRVQGITERINRYASPNETFFIFGEASIFYFFTNRLNPTRYADMAFVVEESMVQEVLDGLKENPPHLIMAVGDQTGLLYKSYHQPIASYINTHYRIIDRFSWYVFLTPK